MRKIRFILLMILSLMISGSSVAAELTVAQKNFRSALQSFLKEEGFMPTIDDEDNSLNFKKEGTLYWISFGGSNPIYIEFHRVGLGCEDADKSLVLQAVNAANKKVCCAKAFCNDKTVSFTVEMYCHSAEEFKYVFYKCLKELQNIYEEVSNYYNGANDSSDNSSVSNSYGSSSSSIKKFFPIYGVTLGETTLSQAQSMGYSVQTNDSGNKKVKVNDLTIWDFDNDGILDFVALYEDDAVPESLKKLGINWSLSYNQLMEKFKDLGFSVTVTKQPQTEKWSGRDTLNAEFRAISPDNTFKVDVNFRFGNENGEGYSVNARNSFRSMTFIMNK